MDCSDKAAIVYYFSGMRGILKHGVKAAVRKTVERTGKRFREEVTC